MLVLAGRAFVDGALREACLGIEDGRIVRIAKTLRGDERRDFGDALLLPGAIDLHVHFREPGATHKEDFRTGTAAAAIGGVTCVFDMPNTKPPVTTPAAFEEKLETVKRKANVDFGLYAAAVDGVDPAPVLARAHGLKVYMAESGGGLALHDRNALPRAIASAAGKPVVVHAEDAAALVKRRAETLKEYAATRPMEAEVSAVRTVLSHAGGARVHVTHVSGGTTTGLLRGTVVTADATPHHLFLDWNADLGARGKVNPPLRSPEDRRSLWDAFVRGDVRLAASDHAPHAVEEKEDFPEAPPGVPGVETLVPLLLGRVKRGDLPLPRFVEAVSGGPAALFGLNKGALAVGRDADILVAEMTAARVRAEDLHSRCGWTPYEGWEGIFPVSVWLRGHEVARDREMEAERLGRPVPYAAVSSSAIA